LEITLQQELDFLLRSGSLNALLCSMPAAARLKLSMINPNGYKYNSCAEAGLAAVGGG
jgi:hypothetical protein